MHPPSDPAQLALTHVPQYLALPEFMQGNTKAVGTEVASSALQFLEDIGHQHPQFDRLSALTQGILTGLSDFKNVSGDKEQLSLLSEQLDGVIKQLRFAPGDDLQMLKPMLKTVQLAVDSASLDKVSPSLFLGMSMASTGINASESSVGIVSKPMQSLVSTLSSGLQENGLKKASHGEKQLLPLLMNSLFLSAAALPLAVKAEDGRPLLSDLSIRLMVESRSLQATTDAIAYVSGAQAKEARAISASLQLVSILTALRTASDQKADRMRDLVEGMHEKLTSLAKEAAEFVNNTGGGHPWDLLTQQGLNALNEKDFEAFTELVETSAHTLNEDGKVDPHKELKDFMENIQTFTGKKMQEDMSIQTAISQGG
jgi:hypothetical protein